jgi:SpoVK/Ycf46/Vps4 family AAA+-type ATPase
MNKNRKYFSVRRDEDYYYAVEYRNTWLPTKKDIEFSFCKTEDDANYIIEQMISIIPDWKPIKNIVWLYENDLEQYKKVLNVLRNKTQKTRDNGNYLSTLKEGTVHFRIGTKQHSGSHLELGLVYTQGELYLPFLNKSLLKIDNLDAARRFNQTFSGLIWFNTNEYVMNCIANKDVKSIFVQAKDLANNGEVMVLSREQERTVINSLYATNKEKLEKSQVLYEKLDQLNKMRGLYQIKETTQNLIKQQRAERILDLDTFSSKNNYSSLFVGSSGTGKTEVARLYADILWSLGVIPERKFMEVSKEDFVSQYIGETEVKTKEVIKQAKGGVLFVDEAYMLANNTEKNEKDYGKIALEIIMRAMENEKNNLTVIFAGYETEIENLLDVNQGLRSRFPNKFIFEPYSKSELVEIMKDSIKSKGFMLQVYDQTLINYFEKQMQNGELLGNGRTVRNLVERLIIEQKIALSNNLGLEPKIILPQIVEKALLQKTKRNEVALDELAKNGIEKLNKLIGLDTIKAEVLNWTNHLQIERKRAILNINSKKPMLHLEFRGSPGTSKTTVARIIADILKGTGLISRGHFKEVTRADLVAEYMGQTSIKVKNVIKEMDGGVLFIDEAYSLIQGDNDVFGKEAVDTLIAEMENKREDLVIILAGYQDDMEQLMNSNPGFRSRVSKSFVFEDYSSSELLDIFKLKLEQENFAIEVQALEEVRKYIEKQKQNGQIDGNGRWVRNLLEQINMKASNRLISIEDPTLYDLQTFVVDDVLKVAN